MLMINVGYFILSMGKFNYLNKSIKNKRMNIPLKHSRLI